MNPSQHKALFILVTAVLALLVASPALQRTLGFPITEFFTELSILGPGHMAESYPYNITSNQQYTVFLGITNQLGSCAYYQIEVKFRNETQSAPNTFNRTPSSQPSLYNFTAVVADKESLEIPVNFALTYFWTTTKISFQSLNLNDATSNLRGQYTDWNPETNTFYSNLIFELWIYNTTIGEFQYHERYVDLRLNITPTQS